MKLVLMGIQGAGKSTQGNLLVKQLGLPYLSTGHIFRRIAKEKTQLGRYIKTVMNAGILIPDDKTIEIVNSYLSRKEYANGYILDGFPRTLAQAKKFINHVDKVIYVDIPDKDALWRLAYRKDDDRIDNTIQALKKRIESFKKLTVPVLDYYRKKGKLADIDGTQTVEEVNQEILKSLGKQLIENKLSAWQQHKKAIIAIVGLPGSGKSEAAAHFKSRKVPVIHFGKVVTDEVQKRYHAQKEEYHKIVREELRRTHGMEAMAKLNLESIKKDLKKNNIVVIDGMRSWKEYEYLTLELKHTDIYIMALFAEKNIRYSRLGSRTQDRPGHGGEKRDINELFGTNMGPTIAFADFLVKNNFSKEEFQDKLDEVYDTVYFS